MIPLPEDIANALERQPGLMRGYALEQAFTYAIAATAAIDVKVEDGRVSRAHISCLTDVSRTWSDIATALGGAQ